MKYTLISDGFIIEAANAVEVVEKLRQSSRLGANDSNGKYMESFLKRVKILDGIDIPSESISEETFVQALLYYGILKRIE